MDTLELSKQLIKMHRYDGSEGKAEAADFIANYMEKGGLHVEKITSNGIVNVVGSTKGRKKNSRKIILNGHYDTVPPSDQWTVNPFDPVVKNGELWGLGSCDMTANLAAMINAAIEVSKQNLQGEVVLVAVGDEETGGANGTKATIEKGVIADYCVIGEPTTMRLATGHKARIHMELTAEGKGGHAAYPTEGKNAIHEMSRAIAKLADEYEHKTYDHETIFKQPTMNATLISGGTAENVVPFQCKAILDFRIPPTFDGKKFVEEIEKKLPEQVTVSGKEIGLGWTSDEKSPFIKTAAIVLEGVTGKKITEYMHKLGASDARFYSNACIPTINVGAGQMKLHVPDEKIEWKQVEQAEKFYSEIAKKMVG